jgi:hypothetical protein
MGVSRNIGMKRGAMRFVVGGVIFVSMQAFAADPINQPPISKREVIKQMIDCVKKRVSNRTVSYDAAIRSCKDAVNKQAEDSTSETLIASDVPAKP